MKDIRELRSILLCCECGRTRVPTGDLYMTCPYGCEKLRPLPKKYKSLVRQLKWAELLNEYRVASRKTPVQQVLVH